MSPGLSLWHRAGYTVSGNKPKGNFRLDSLSPDLGDKANREKWLTVLERVKSGEMAVAYWWVHAPGSFFPLLSGGEGALLYCFAFLYLAAAGGGAWSLDALRREWA